MAPPPQPPSPPAGSSSSTPTPPPVAPTTSSYHTPHDPWTGLVQAWPMPWTAPSAYGAPPAYTGTWSPGLRPSTGAPGPLSSRPPSHVYMAQPTYGSPTPPSFYYGSSPGYPTTTTSYMPGVPHTIPYMTPPSVAQLSSASPSPPTWDQVAFIAAMNNFTLNNQGTDWIFDSGASSHMSSNMNLLSSCSPSQFSSIIVGNGSSIPITCTGHSYIPHPTQPFTLPHILVSPSLIKNLISVRQFTTDNSVSIELDRKSVV